MTGVDIASRCRICFEESNFHCNIYSKKDSEFICLGDVINDLCQLNVREDDGYPKYICGDCSIKLCDFKCFKQKSRTTMSILSLLKGDNVAFNPTTQDDCSTIENDSPEVQSRSNTSEESERRSSSNNVSSIDKSIQRTLTGKRLLMMRGRTKRCVSSGRTIKSNQLSTSSAANADAEINLSMSTTEINSADVNSPVTVDQSDTVILVQGDPMYIKQEQDEFEMDPDAGNDDEVLDTEDDCLSLVEDTGGVTQVITDSNTTSTSRNKPKLIHKGFMYTFDKLSTNGGRKYWRCERRSQKCYGRLHTKLDDAVICEVGSHNHDGDQTAIKAAKLRNSISRVALECDGPVDEVVNKVLEGFSAEERKQLPSKDAIRKFVRRKRTQGKGHHTTDPYSSSWGEVQCE